ncbi:immunoglobulin-like domain-containing protein [Paenibacillus soyae]|uniref:DNRLRE domain-containing protein n=1 Tax=Paenibacillus soyae TaxID=2969249 RepID=A0A9X2MU48_9BACL|nr:immunoglobulin-like domain-containing protein [Paenibacillus soyae]MCR2806309.1 DNRLRE domain-containing protein [Paenibacillus soyae]
MHKTLWKRALSTTLAASMALSLTLGAVPPVYAADDPAPSTVVVKLSPTDDASVNASSSAVNTNYASGTLILGAGRQFMMKFDLSGITDPITGATLKLYKTNTNAATFSVYRSEADRWSEASVTYANRPEDPAEDSLIENACGSSLCAANGGAGTLVPIQLTDAVLAESAGDKLLSLVFKRDNIAATPGADLASKEHANAAWRPVLEVSTLRHLTDTERVANDKARLLEQFDNQTVTDNLTLPAEGETNTAIAWSSSHPEILSESGVVARPEYTESDVQVTLTANIAFGSVTDTADMTVTVQKQPTPTDDQRVARDKGLLIGEYNNMTVYEDVILRSVGSYGFSVIGWSSDSPDVITNAGKVTRPAADGQDANVKMRAVLTYGTVSETIVLNMLVPKLGERTDSKEQQALSDMLELAARLKDRYSVGSNPGQVPQSAMDQWTARIASAQSALSDPAGDLELGIKQLREGGTAFLKSIAASDRVIDAEANKLEFSAYRKELIALVWEAETLLLIDPEMHTQASKQAIRDQIDHAEAVLAGTYEVPFVRHREFYKPRPDEDIQFAIEHYSKASHPYSQKYGLKELIALYPDSHILAGTYQTVRLQPTDDAFVWTSEKTTTHNGSSLIYSEGRTAYMRFDLSGVAGAVKKAELRVTNWKSDRNTTQVHYEANDDWQESTLVYPATGEPELGPIVKTFILGAKDAAGTGYADLTTPVNVELLGDQVLTLGFSNVPGTRWASEIHSKDTANPSYRPYLELSLNQIVDAKLQEKFDRIVGLANELAGNAVVGDEGWQYPQAVVDAVKASVAAAKQANSEGDPERTAAALVQVYDAMKAMRDAQVLRSEAEPGSSLYWTENGLQELRDKIEQNPDLKTKYEEAKQIADEQSLEDILAQRSFLQSEIDYDAANDRYKLWSSSEPLNFTPPAGTASIRLQFTLDAADNEAGGLGHAWVDNVKISPADAADLNIRNADFEEGELAPEHWTPTAVKGNPIMKWENRANYSSTGNRSLYIENPTSSDQGAWTSQQAIAVAPGLSHTLTFAAKIDGKLKSGVKAIITYKDANGSTLGSAELVTNRKSTIAPPSNLAVQANALTYAITGDIDYARKTKELVDLRLNDFLQGAEHWLVKDSRPDNIDAYGKVQGGRVASIVASALTFIKDAEVYSDEEYRNLIRKLNYFMLFLNDGRDRNELDDYSVQLGASNWESDAVLGASMLAMVYPELDNAKQYIANANKLIKAQLQYAVGDEGEWPESVRYHFAVLQRFAAYAKSLRNQTGEDWFALPKLVKMFQYNMEVQTPAYAFTGGSINSPVFGDDTMTAGNEFSLLGIYYDEVARTNETLASHMYQTWVKAGSRLPANGVETILLESFFAPLDDGPAHSPLALQSTDRYKGVGLVMFRDHFGTPKDTFMSIMANAAPLGHGHYDQGSFTLYADSTPLVLDPGIESYFAGTKSWYVGSASHATVQFRKTDNWSYLNTPAVSTNHAFTTNEHLDTMSLRIADSNANSAGSQTRTIAYVKDGLEAFLIWDRIQGSPSAETIWNLPVASAALSDIDGNKITSTGHFGMDLETTILQPANPSITQEWGRATNMVPAVDGETKLEYIRVTNDPNQNYLTVLYPKAKGAEGLKKAEKLPIGAGPVDVYLLETASGQQAYAVVNNGDADAQIVLPSAKSLADLKTGTGYPSVGGEVTVTAAAASLTVFKAPAEQTPDIPDGSGIGIVLPGGQDLLNIGQDGVVDAGTLGDALKQSARVTIQTKGDIVILPASALAETAEGSDAELEIITANGTYLLPLAVLDLQKLSAEFNVPMTELSIHVGVTKVAGEAEQAVIDKMTSIGASALADVIDFSLTVRSSVGKSVAIESFGSLYVKRTIPLREPASSSATVALFDPATGIFSFVPSRFGESEAEFYRPGNSIYTVLEVNRTFEDLVGHWANSDIEQMAGKLIVNGVTAASFAPEREITRAEFAALIVRSLGLTIDGDGKTGFSDVGSGDWYAAAVATAVSAGIVNGYADGTFRPEAFITREELAAMVIRALKFAGNPAEELSSDELADILGESKDADYIVWAHQELAQAVRTGIVIGKEEFMLAPRALATRAEAAVMIKRFLKQAEFID